MPEHAHKAAMKELKRMKKMTAQMPEHAMIRNYLEMMAELPWSKSSKDALDIVNARYVSSYSRLVSFLPSNLCLFT